MPVGSFCELFYCLSPLVKPAPNYPPAVGPDPPEAPPPLGPGPPGPPAPKFLIPLFGEWGGLFGLSDCYCDAPCLVFEKYADSSVILTFFKTSERHSTFSLSLANNLSLR